MAASRMSLNSDAPARNLEPGASEPERYELREAPSYIFALDRRLFLQTCTGGFLLLALGCQDANGQRAEPQSAVDARIRFADDGSITVYNGKVEEGQGARTEIAMAAAEELGANMQQIRVQMADTALTPDDGITAGSRTTPSTLPAIREAAVAGRMLLLGFAAGKWNIETSKLAVQDGKVTEPRSGQTFSYADLAKAEGFLREQGKPDGGSQRTPEEWKILGVGHGRVNGIDVVTGKHIFPSDIRRPGMLYGAVLRPPAYGARLKDFPASPKAPEAIQVVRDGDFVGVVAADAFAASQALFLVEQQAKWEAPGPARQEDLWDSFRKTAQGKGPGEDAAMASALEASAKRVRGTFRVPYIQHVPMEPRSAVAEWEGGQLTVWTGTSNPFRVRQDLAQAFGIIAEQVRVIVPDFGGGFGGKHTGEAALEAARMAREVKRPVWLRWTRQEEFAWAYFRPAALIEIDAGLSADGTLSAWEFLNYNAGGSGIRTPYVVPRLREEFLRTETPLRQGSYRALASTANNFARETLMDELASAAGKDPLAFRLAHLKDERMRGVLEAAAERFGWASRRSGSTEERAVGIACGTEKNSVVATCAEVELDARSGMPRVIGVTQAYECGAILNPAGLLQQVEGCMVMALGAVLREKIEYKDGIVSNASFRSYEVPRMSDLPPMDIVLLDRRNSTPVGAGETPMMSLAPAIANAVFALTGKPVRELPIRAEAKKG
jgi:CO/xanthine dehydrogenase Mo-binding subunit